MIELGKKQTLVVVREKDFGIYLAEKQGDEASVLLPKKQVPAGTKIGDNVEVGCGSVLNPGTVIGRQSNIYPLSSVRGVVPAHSIYKKQGEVVKKHED